MKAVDASGASQARSFAIGELAKKTGLRASAIRYYESAGLLPEPLRLNGRRVYDASILEWLAVVRLAQRAGFTIAEIRTLLHGFKRSTPASQRWRKLATAKLTEVRERIDEARAMKRMLERLLDCECPTLRDCVSEDDAELVCGERC